MAFASRSSSESTLGFAATLLSSSFTAANSVVNGIHPEPGKFTGGEGPVRGQEVRFNVSFTSPFDLGADRYFFVPQVQLSAGEFLWLSTPKPIAAPADLQSWIRDEDLQPDWLRLGTDITHQGRFNASFSLTGNRPRAFHLGDDDPRFRWRWLHGVSPSQSERVASRSLITSPIGYAERPPSGGLFVLAPIMRGWIQDSISRRLRSVPSPLTIP